MADRCFPENRKTEYLKNCLIKSNLMNCQYSGSEKSPFTLLNILNKNASNL